MSIYCRKLLVLKIIDLSQLRTLIAVGKLNQNRSVIFGNSLKNLIHNKVTDDLQHQKSEKKLVQLIHGSDYELVDR